MIQDRAELNKTLNIEAFFPPFFSILIPELGRPQYTLKCVEHLHKNADMPIEIIVHDDGIKIDNRRLLLDMLGDKVSTIIFNCGKNVGLARAMNRCKDAASSQYLLEFNSDTYMTTGFLKNMKAALDLPYVGIVNVSPKINDGPGVYTTPEGVKIALTRNSGTTLHMGMHREVYDEVGGWDENVQTTASDTGFVGYVFGHGYFSVLVEGTIYNEMWMPTPDGKTNIGESNPTYIPSSSFTDHDNNPPPIFGLKSGVFEGLRHRRREAIWHGTNDFSLKEHLYKSWFNGAYLNDQVHKLYKQDGTIDWEFAKEYGHDKWKDMIIEDFKIKVK